MKTFLVANNSITRGLDDAAEGANAETPGATAATAAKKARDDGDNFIALKCPSSVEWRNWKVLWNRGMQPAKQIIINMHANAPIFEAASQALVGIGIGRQAAREARGRSAAQTTSRPKQSHTQITDRKTQNDRRRGSRSLAPLRSRSMAGCATLLTRR